MLNYSIEMVFILFFSADESELFYIGILSENISFPG